MTGFGSGSVDARGFSWKLAPLQRKLDWELEAAKGRLEKALRSALQADARTRELEAACAEQAAGASRAIEAGLNPQVHRQALRYLQAAGDRISVVQREQSLIAQEVDAARNACAEAQCRVDVLAAARDVQWQAHSVSAQRQEANDADAAWLVRRRAPRQVETTGKELP